MILTEVIKDERVLICYPGIEVKKSWIKEMEIWGKSNCDITLSTFASLKKFSEFDFDVVVVDELHKLSLKQRNDLKKITGKKVYMSGTVSRKTNEWLALGKIPIINEYTTEEGIKDGIITDFEINIVAVDLEEELVEKYKKISNRINYLLDTFQHGKLKMASLSRMRLLHSNKNKVNAVKKLIEENHDKRVLVFSSQIDLIEQFNIPTYHSGNKNKELKDQFCSGLGDKLGVLKMFDVGVTVKPINIFILHNFTSNPESIEQQLNRITGFEYNNPEKKAIIYIVCTRDTQEVKWLQRALEFIPKNKIKFI